jgi:acyl dehydratase
VSLVAGRELLPRVEEVTFRQVVMGAGATGDWFPGHYDTELARAQGQPTIYANSLHLFGLLDKAATSWVGPTAFLVRRAVRLAESVYAGDTVTIGGTVARVDADGTVELALVATNQRGGTVCTAELTLRPA